MGGVWVLAKRVGCIEFIWAEGWIRLEAQIYFVKQYFYLKPITMCQMVG